LDASEKKQIWRDSLLAMKNSLLGTYELTTTVYEQEKFLRCWNPDGPDYLVFSDYRRNEGRRRIQDVMEVIDDALERLDRCDTREASRIFLQTMKQVARFSRLARLIEDTRESFGRT